MTAEQHPALRAAVKAMIKDPEAMKVGLPKLLAGQMPDLNEPGGGSGFFVGADIMYFWPKGEEEERALAEGLAHLITDDLPEMFRRKDLGADGLAFNAFFLASALKRPEQLYKALKSFPEGLVSVTDEELDLDPYAGMSHSFLLTALEANTPTPQPKTNPPR